jgi:sec-independent protein translocase protein TatC
MFNFVNHFNELILIAHYIILSFILTFFSSYFFAPQIIKILSTPFLKFVKTEDYDFIFTNIFEVFNTYIVLAMYTSILFSIPIAIYFFLLFIKPGLLKYEKKMILFSFKTISCFVLFSILLTYYVIFPCLLSFLLNLDLIIKNNFIVLKMETKLFEYIIFFYKLLFLYCFIVFQIPALFIIFVYIKQPKQFLFYKKRKACIILCLIIGCIFSSPDLISLFLISFPLIFFFELITFIYILKSNYNYFQQKI